MISKYPLKKHTNIKRDLRLKTLTDIAIREGLPTAKEHSIKIYNISESTWEHVYLPLIRQNLKDHSPKEHYLTTPFDMRVNWKKASELK